MLLEPLDHSDVRQAEGAAAFEHQAKAGAIGRRSICGVSIPRIGQPARTDSQNSQTHSHE